MYLSQLPSEVHWAFKSGTSATWLPTAPAITETGEVRFEADGVFITAFRDWLAGFIRGHASSLNCEVLVFDALFKETGRWAFASALIRTLAFPTLDASLSTPARMTVNLRVPASKKMPGSGGPPQIATAKAQSLWKCCNFTLTIAGLDTSMVSHVDAMRVVAPGTFPEIRILVPESVLPQFAEWQKKGTPGQAQILFLKPDMQKLFALSFTAKVSSLAPAGQSMLTGGGTLGRFHAGITRVPVSLTVASPVLSA